MPHTRSVSISIYVGTGSRYERIEEAGISHFLEHLCFKGTKKRPTAKEIAESIDGVGGYLNGGTDREFTVFYAKVAAQHLQLALDVLLDLIREPLLDSREMEKERQVVLEELAMVADSPPQLAELLMDAALWPNQPLGRDVAGSRESVVAMTRDMVLDYQGRQYVPNNLVIAVAGQMEHQQVADAVWQARGPWEAGQPRSWVPAADGGGPRCSLRHKATEQAHLSLALRGLALGHPDRHALSLLSLILGEGMSSRLFLDLREQRGLVYDIHSYVTHFLDTGAFAIYTGVDPRKAGEALQRVLAEVARLRDEGVEERELVKAREMAKGRLLLRLEDSRAVSGWIGGQELLLGQVRSVEEALADLAAVTTEDVQRVARQLLVSEGLHLAVVGPYRSDKRFVASLRL
jgi:predicted Zn-dependent peptidase